MEIKAIAAVSKRKILGPSRTGTKPAFMRADTSSSSQPPSGPIAATISEQRRRTRMSRLDLPPRHVPVQIPLKYLVPLPAQTSRQNGPCPRTCQFVGLLSGRTGRSPHARFWTSVPSSSPLCFRPGRTGSSRHGNGQARNPQFRCLPHDHIHYIRTGSPTARVRCSWDSTIEQSSLPVSRTDARPFLNAAISPLHAPPSPSRSSIRSPACRRTHVPVMRGLGEEVHTSRICVNALNEEAFTGHFSLHSEDVGKYQWKKS